jgi:hypothetical protein
MTMATRSRTTTTRKTDWSLAPRGTISATVQAAAGLVATAGVGDVAHIHPEFGAIGAGVGALSHVVVSAFHAKHTPSAILYRLACWAGAGSWLTWGLAEHHWMSSGSLAALAIGAAGAGIAAPLASRTRDEHPGRTLVLRSSARAGEEWEARFKRVCSQNVTVADVKPWATGAGKDVYGKLPTGGATLQQLKAHATALATDADLPDGCGIEFESAGTRATFVAHVSTVNRLLETIDYPEDYSPRSIYDPIDIGEHRNSTLAAVELRENSGVVVGQKRSGKTNTIDVMTVGVGRCRDAMVLHIDLNGGGVSQAWLHPWLDGETDRPAIPWAASNPLEALYLTTVALAVAKHRKSAYRRFKVTSDSKLLQISPDLPEWVIFVDEGAESMGLGANKDPILRQVRDNLEEIQRIGGNEGVNIVPSALRATQDMISPAVIKQSRIRIGMLVQDHEELAYLFGWQHRSSIDPADLAGQGSGFIATGPETPKPFKAYRMLPSQIVRAAVAIAKQRPELDAASAAVADGEFELDLGGRKPVIVSGLYSGRYDRMRAAFTGEQAPTAEVAIPEPAEVEKYAPLRLVAGGNAADWPDLRGGAEPADTVELSDAAAWPTLSTSPKTATSTPAGVLTAARVQPVPEILTRALAAFDDARDDRMHSETLAAALGIGNLHEMSELLRPLEVRPLASWFMRNGDRARGYARESFAEAASRVALGELEVPAAVAAWPAA